MHSERIFTVNPGSTSTKVTLFSGETVLFTANVPHSAGELAAFPSLSAQLSYRLDKIETLLRENGVDLTGIAAVVGRGGGLLPLEGGTYRIDGLLLRHAAEGANGIQHPANLGPQLAKHFADQHGAAAFVVNPPDVDELQDVARITGIRDVCRTVHLHALNLKETAIRHAARVHKRYEDCNFIVCHIGGGISVSAHRRGRMVDGFDIVGGEGPMAPTRCGAVSVAELLRYAKGKDLRDVRQLCTKTGGFVSWTGKSDALELRQQADAGHRKAQLLWNGMLYQIEKCIGAMAAVLKGEIDGILLGGSMARDKDLVEKVTDACEWIAPVAVYPGEFEMEAMAAGALRVLRGHENAKTYTGISCFQGFDFELRPGEEEGEAE